MWRATFYVIFIYVLYLQCGALLFYIYEAENLLGIKRTIRNSTFRPIINILLSKGIEERILDEAGASVKNAFDKNFVNEEIGETPQVWDFFNALFFSVSLTTTIGYGNIAPNTSVGLLICMAYILFGIPLNNIILEHIAERNSHFLQSVNTEPITEATSTIRKICKYLCILCYMACMIASTFVISSITFMYIENWSFLEGVYYSFFTVTTVGFGDYVAGSNLAHDVLDILYKCFFYIWLLIGLPFMSMIFSYTTHFYLIHGLFACHCTKFGPKLTRVRFLFEDQSFHETIYASEDRERGSFDASAAGPRERSKRRRDSMIEIEHQDALETIEYLDETIENTRAEYTIRIEELKRRKSLLISQYQQITLDDRIEE